MVHIPVTIPLFKKNYLAMIRNAVRGENALFRNFYITVDGIERDSLVDGALSCAVFVSSVLYLQNSTLDFLKKPKLISFVHALVASTERDMEKNGWTLISDLKPGAVVIWESVEGREIPVFGTLHSHMGFCLGDDRAISNGSNSSGIPVEHHVTYDGTRKIIRIWWHTVLDEN